VMFQRQPLRRMPRLLENKYYVTRFMMPTIIQPILVRLAGRAVEDIRSRRDDGIVNGLGRLVTRFGG